MDLIGLHIHPDLDVHDEILEILINDSPSFLDDYNENDNIDGNGFLFEAKIREYLSFEDWEIRDARVKKMVSMLNGITPEAIKKIKALDLDVSLRIHNKEFLLPLHSDLVQACARLNIDIFILQVV